MAKQLTIKEISLRAGVSPGTVDRVIHNRGKVSAENLAKVQQVLCDYGYRNNLHTSAVALKKQFRIALAVPSHISGDYWSRVDDGFQQAMTEYSDIAMDTIAFFYDQFDEDSCRRQFEAVPDIKPDAVIIGPTFEEETVDLCRHLDSEGIPYSFVDALPAETSPVDAFTTDQHAGGYLLGKLVSGATPDGSPIAIMHSKRKGGESYDSVKRMSGLTEYLQKTGRQYLELPFSMSSPVDNITEMHDFLESNPSVKGIAVVNSRGNLVADALRAIGREDVTVGGFDLTSDNAHCLSEGSISVLLCQRPALQGFYALRSLLEWLLYRTKPENSSTTMPIDIVMKENLPFYKDSADL